MRKLVIPFLVVFMLFAFSAVAFAEGESVSDPEPVEVSEPVPEPTPEPVVDPEPVEVTEPTEVEEEIPAKVTEPVSAEEMLILNSVVGVPDSLQVTLSLGSRDVAVVKGNQILHQETFPANQKTYLKIRLEGEGRLVGAKFNFQPPVAPEIPVPPVAPKEPAPVGGSPVEEPEQQEKSIGEDIAESEEITEVEEEIEPEIPADEDITEPEEDEDVTEPVEEPTEEQPDITEDEPAEVDEGDLTEDTTETEDSTVGDGGDVAEGEDTTESESTDVGDTNSDVAEGDSGDAGNEE